MTRKIRTPEQLTIYGLSTGWKGAGPQRPPAGGASWVICEKSSAPKPKKERHTPRGAAFKLATDTKKGGARRARPVQPGTAILAQAFENVKRQR